MEDKEKLQEKENHRVFRQLLNTFINGENEIKKENNEEIAKNIKIIPKIYYDDFSKSMKVEFKIGEKQFYKIKNLPEFYTKMLRQEPYQYGTKLNLINKRESFIDESLPLLEFILKYSEIMKYSNDVANNYTTYTKNYELDHIFISNMGLDDLFRTLKGKKVIFQRNGNEKNVEFKSENLEIPLKISQLNDGRFELCVNIDIFEYDILEGKDYKYLLLKDKIYRCNYEDKNMLRLLEVFRKNYKNKIVIDKQELTNFYSVIYPNIQTEIIEENISSNIKEKCIPKKLSAKIYLDYDKNNYITADIKFCYDDYEFNPIENKNIEIARNITKENEILSRFLKTGFMLDRINSRLVLIKDDQIYNFLSFEIEDYMKKYEVLATDTFKNKDIATFKIKNIGVRIENNLLEIDLSKVGVNLSDLKEMIDKYRLKKKYHRLKDGSFIELEENDTMEVLDNLTKNLEIDEKNIEKGVFNIPMYRALYLDRMLKKLKNVEINKDEDYKKMINQLSCENEAINEVKIPQNLNANLRTYQKIGYKWLKTLDEYRFGGILADDMGLGKTIQVLSVILSYINESKEKNKKYYPSIIVCPSSLTLNWLGEIEKFTPTLSSIVISGNAEYRKNKIKEISQYDIAIISYDSLKRDIELFGEENINFKFMIADEAQYIKNNNTQNSKSIKKIKAETRFALTGTPIENSLSELWSIFDFIMPGYLFKYKKFKEMYEIPIVKENSQKHMEQLKKVIEPFVLRRIKKEVLTELPDKTVTVLYNEMEEEQEKIYLSYLARAKKEVADEIELNGIQNSQIKILALLMRLRQICCHPNLFLEDYNGESSKLNQCIEVVKGAVEGGHKLLLFSGYTSMFSIIEKKLKENNINYFKLTGQTKVAERIELVDKFNEDKDVKVFLISLKAGGTGLNLTGADMVIHYDPWWNLSAENQATDRTYRIGQKNNVQVYKLITKNSIEEKIYELQAKKAKLMDNILSTKNTFINQLSKEDIMDLFG